MNATATKTPTRYNVYVVRDADDVACALVGKELTGERADVRSETVNDRIDYRNYTTLAPKVGSPDDLRYAEDVATKRAEKPAEPKEEKEDEPATESAWL